MGLLLKLELKKIIRSKMTLFVLLGSLLITGVLFGMSVLGEISVDSNGVQYTGKDAFELQKTYDREVAGILSEKKVKETITTYQELYKNKDNTIVDANGQEYLTDDVYIKNVQPYYTYYQTIDGAFTEPSTVDMQLQVLKGVDLNTSFYEARENKINKLLNQEYLDWNFSKVEKNYWINKTNNIETPIEYGYCGGWKAFLNSDDLLLVAIIAVCICLAPIFAGEYQAKTDSIVLTSKYGKTKLVSAKIVAAFIFGSLAFLLHVLLALGIQLTVAGTDGANLQIQITNIISPYKLTLISATLLAILIDFLVLWTMIGLTLLISAKLKSTFLTLIIDVLILLIPQFLSLSETSGIWNHILLILPSTAIQTVFSEDYLGYFSYPFGNVVLNIVDMRIIIYAILSIIFVPFAARAFKNHEVF